MISANYERFAAHAARLAVMFASFDNSNVVETKHWVKAQEIVEKFRIGAHQLFDDMNTIDEPPNKTKEDKMINALTTAKENGLTLSQLHNRAFRNSMTILKVEQFIAPYVKRGSIKMLPTRKKATPKYVLAMFVK